METGGKGTLPRVSIRTTLESNNSAPSPQVCSKCGKVMPPQEIQSWRNKIWIWPGYDSRHDVCEDCVPAVEKEAREKERREKLESIKNHLEIHLEEAKIPLKYRTCSFENFSASGQLAPVLRRCQEYAKDPRGGLLLHGAYGVGKTHLAVAIAREIILQGRRIEFVYVPKLLRKIRRAFRDDYQGPDELALISRYAEELPYLVLDDIGVEKITDWARQTLDVIFYERDAHNLATVITSNLSPDEIEKKIDARISSRIAGMGKILPLIGPDYRISSRTKGG